MPIPVYLPKFDPSHEQSEILSWLAGEGDTVRAGDPICDVETDKTNMEVEAPQDGVLAGIRYQAGEIAPAASVIAYVLLEGESLADLPADEETPVTTANTAAQTTSSPRAGNFDLMAVTGSGPRGRIMRRDVERQTINTPGKIRATPAARRLARLNKLDLATLNGTGPRGRIQAADAQAIIDAQTPISSIFDGENQTIQLVGMRKRIADRMRHSFQTAPHIFMEMPVDMTQVEGFRRDLSAAGEKLSLTTVLVKACAWTLKRNPRLNATLEGDSLTLWAHANIGIAVALDDGLIVPVVPTADRLSLSEIQLTSEDLIGRARAHKLQAGEVADGTFTISNLGMFGVSRFTAIINPPQVAILAVGRVAKQFVPDENDQPVLKPIMNSILSVDHRAVDGAVAARFLQDLRRVLEQPILLAW